MIWYHLYLKATLFHNYTINSKYNLFPTQHLKMFPYLFSTVMLPRAGQTRSHVAIIADVAFISLWRLHKEKKHMVAKGVVYFEQFWSCLRSTSYILVDTVLHPAVPLCYHGYWDSCEEEMPRINNPPLEVAASDSVTVAVSKLLTESTCLGYRFWQLIFSCRGSLKSKLSVPDFVSHCIDISPSSARQKWDRKPGLEAAGVGLMLTLIPK